MNIPGQPDRQSGEPLHRPPSDDPRDETIDTRDRAGVGELRSRRDDSEFWGRDSRAWATAAPAERDRSDPPGEREAARPSAGRPSQTGPDGGPVRVAWITTLAAAATTAVGAFMTWLSVGWASADGIDGDGRITLAAATIAGLVAVAARANVKLWPIVGVLCGGVILSIGLYHFINMRGVSWSTEWFEINPNPGGGLYLTLLAGAALIGSGVSAMAQIGRTRAGCIMTGVVLTIGLTVTIIGDPYGEPDDIADEEAMSSDDFDDWLDDDDAAVRLDADGTECDEMWAPAVTVTDELVSEPCLDETGSLRFPGAATSDCVSWNDYGWWTDDDPTLRAHASGLSAPSFDEIEAACP